MIKYSELTKLLRPYFQAKGGSFIFSGDNMHGYIELAIMDIYNYHNWYFQNYSETITASEEDKNFFYKTKYPIKGLNDESNIDIGNESDTGYVITEEGLRGPKPGQRSITLHYKINYKFRSYKPDDLIPLPEKFIPALCFLVRDFASPMMIFESEQNVINYYNEFVKRMELLKQSNFPGSSSSFTL